MPLISTDEESKLWKYRKGHIKYIKTYEDKLKEESREVCKKMKQEEREQRNEERNMRQREQYEYYVGLYEKYKSKDWDYVKMMLDGDKEKERIKNEKIRKANQKKWDDATGVLNHFGLQRKKDMYPPDEIDLKWKFS